jgi:hypothetical protein
MSPTGRTGARSRIRRGRLNRIMRGCLAVLLLAGCASTSKVVPYGKDTYAEEANSHCAKLGKAMHVKNATPSGNWWVGRSMTLIFTCIDK